MISPASLSQIETNKRKTQQPAAASHTRKALALMTGLLGEPAGRLSLPLRPFKIVYKFSGADAGEHLKQTGLSGFPPA